MKITTKIITGVVIGLLVIDCFYGLFLVNSKRKEEMQRLATKIKTTNELFKYTCAGLVWDMDQAKLADNLNTFQQDLEIIKIKVIDKTGKINITTQSKEPNSSEPIEQNFVLEHNQQIIANVSIIYSTDVVESRINTTIRQIVFLTLLLGLASMVIIYFISKFFLRPIEKIVTALQRMDKGEYDYVLNLPTNDEFKQIEVYFNKMASAILNDMLIREDQQNQLEINNLKLEKEIDERGKIEKARQQSEARYRLMADNANDIISQLTPDGIYLYVSSAIEWQLGYKVEELVGKNSYFLIYKDDFDVLQQSHLKILKSGLMDVVSYRVRHKNGEYIWFETSNKVLKDSDGVKITCVSRNITERKLYEEELKDAKRKAEESDLLKSAFLANMSHEIRTPMNGIVGFSELLKKPNITEDKRNQYIDVINKSSYELLNIINDIMDISKIEANQLTINDDDCDIYSLTQDLYTFYLSDLERTGKKVQLRLNYQLDLEKSRIFTDYTRLRQVLFNLISNAIKFTHEGIVEIGCSLIENDSKVLFYIKDTGIGMPDDKKDVIFERFRQLDSSFTRQYGGTGLGLPICKGLVQLLKGEIWVETKMGAGSTFFFTLPYRVPLVSPQPIIIQPVIVPKEKGFSGKTILIVEDDLGSAAFLEEALSETQAKIILAKNGRLAVEACRTNPQIDIVLMDMQLPEMNGYDATQKIKQIRQDLPIIAQTANAMVDDREKCITAGCVDYIPKPIKIQALIKILNKYI